MHLSNHTKIALAALLASLGMLVACGSGETIDGSTDQEATNASIDLGLSMNPQLLDSLTAACKADPSTCAEGGNYTPGTSSASEDQSSSSGDVTVSSSSASDPDPASSSSEEGTSSSIDGSSSSTGSSSSSKPSSSSTTPSSSSVAPSSSSATPSSSSVTPSSNSGSGSSVSIVAKDVKSTFKTGTYSVSINIDWSQTPPKTTGTFRCTIAQACYQPSAVCTVTIDGKTMDKSNDNIPIATDNKTYSLTADVAGDWECQVQW